MTLLRGCRRVYASLSLSPQFPIVTISHHGFEEVQQLMQCFDELSALFYSYLAVNLSVLNDSKAALGLLEDTTGRLFMLLPPSLFVPYSVSKMSHLFALVFIVLAFIVSLPFLS